MPPLRGPNSIILKCQHINIDRSIRTLDGKLNSGIWAAATKPGAAVRVPLLQGEPALMLDQYFTQDRVIMDELKIWSNAKTDLADALENRPISIPS